MEEDHNGDMRRRKKIRKILKHRKTVFVILSMLFAIVNAGMILFDVIALKTKEDPYLSSQNLTFLVLYLNVFGFFFAILGYIHSILAKRMVLAFLGLAGIFSNTTTLLLRVTIEIVFIEYRHEYHNPVSAL